MRLEGKLTSEEDFTILGSMKGSISAPKKSVLVAAGAVVEGSIVASNVKIDSKVKGDVKGTIRAELSATADLEGQLVAREIRVEEGALFRGQVNIVRNPE